MSVWRVSINEIKAERGEAVPEEMTVEVKPSLGKARVEKAGGTEIVKVAYGLTAAYQPGIGTIEVKGDMFFLGMDTKKDIKNGNLVNTEAIRQCYQRIFVEPVVIAIGLAKELKLPLPVRMPEIKVETAGEKAGEAKAAKKKGKKK